MKKRKTAAILLFCAILVIAAGSFAIGNPVVLLNNRRLERSLKAAEPPSVRLNEVVPFAWDVVYTPAPYDSKEKIEQQIGFRSRSIRENNINEGMVHLLFVKDKTVVASVLGYASNLGYSLDLPPRVERSQDVICTVSVSDGIVKLSSAG